MYSGLMNRSLLSALRLIPLTYSLFTFCVVVQAEDVRFPNSEDLRHVKAIASPLLSPDGKQVLFTVTDATADGGKTHLWLVSTARGAARQLTYSPVADKRGEHNGVWAPGGEAILFLAKRGENTQLYRLPLAGGEAMAYDLKVMPIVDDSKEKNAIPPAAAKDPTKPNADVAPKPEEAKALPIAINVSGFAVSPDGHWLAVWAADPETPGEKKNKDAKADAVWVNHERHGERLYLAKLKEDGTLDGLVGGALKLVALAPDVQAASWSPKSDRLLVVNELPNEASDLGPSARGWLVTVETPDAPFALKGIPATVRPSFGWSSDGNEVVFGAQSPEDAPPGYEELFALSLPQTADTALPKDAAQSSAQRLTGKLDGSIEGEAAIYLRGGKVLAGVATGTRITAMRLALDGKAPPEAIPQSNPIVGSLATNEAQTGWVWLTQASDHPQVLCFAQKLGADCEVLPTPELTAQHFKTAKSQLVEWQNDGMTIEGLLYLPTIESGKKAPLIVDVHGGPMGAWSDVYGEWTNFLIGHGWAVLRPNPRGSSAYGIKFAAANKNDLGGGDFLDVMTGVDFVLKNYPIDPDKLALMGYSYGGEMAGFAEGKTDRFKGIISGAPVIDQFSEYGTERGSWYDRWYFGKPWEHFEDVWRQSPLSGVGKAKTPFLLLQGEADGTDPLGQAQEMYRALRQAGVPVDFVSYPREDHGPLARGIFGYPVPEPWHGFDGRQRVVEFLQKAFQEEVK